MAIVVYCGKCEMVYFGNKKSQIEVLLYGEGLKSVDSE